MSEPKVPVGENARFFGRIRSELSLPPGRRKLTAAQVGGLLQLAERGERLRPYVQHLPGCSVRRVLDYGGGVDSGCDCGLGSAWCGPPLPTPPRKAPSGGQ